MRLCSITYTTPVNTLLYWTAPAGVTKIIVHAQGGGGGGGTGGPYYSAGYGGAGGNATYLVPRVITVIPGTTYSLSIGDGGAGGLNTDDFNSGIDGENTFFDTQIWLGAPGGPAGYSFTGTFAGFTASTGGYTVGSTQLVTSGISNFPATTTRPASGTIPNPITGYYGCFSYATATNGTSGGIAGTGGGGNGGFASDAGIGGNGGNGSNSGGVGATDGADAASTSYGAGGGGGGGTRINPSLPGNGGKGAPGRLIITWFE